MFFCCLFHNSRSFSLTQGFLSACHYRIFLSRKSSDLHLDHHVMGIGIHGVLRVNQHWIIRTWIQLSDAEQGDRQSITTFNCQRLSVSEPVGEFWSQTGEGGDNNVTSHPLNPPSVSWLVVSRYFISKVWAIQRRLMIDWHRQGGIADHPLIREQKPTWWLSHQHCQYS